MYAGTLEQRPIGHYGNLFVIHTQRWVHVTELFSFHKQRKVSDIIMLKFVRDGLQLAYKYGVLNHAEQEAFWDGA